MTDPKNDPAKDDTENQHKIDAWKLRAEEWRGRYESMRSLEWRLLFQVYAGYAAIALAFKQVDDKFSHHWLVGCLAITATLSFFGVTHYLYFRVQERLIFFDEKYNAYMGAIEKEAQTLELGPEMSLLGHQYVWTYHTQIILAILTLLGLLAYEGVPAVHTAWACRSRLSRLILGMICLLLASAAVEILICLVRLRMKRKKLALLRARA